MQDSLPLRLGISLIVVFGLLFTGMALYMPFWYRYQLWQLRSANPDGRDAAAEAVAACGKAAMPRIKEWLKSKSDRTVAGACLVLEKMEDDTWEDALEILEPMLDHARSEKTDAVAILFFEKKYAVQIEQWSYRYDFDKYDDKPIRQKNMLLCYLYKARQTRLRQAAVNALESKFHDAPDLFYHIKNVLQNDKNEYVRTVAAAVLGRMLDSRVVEPLIESLEKDSSLYVREKAAFALGKTSCKQAVEPLIKALENDSVSDVRRNAADALGEIGDKRALEPLIKALENDSDSNVRWCAADALGKIGDKRAVEPLVKVLENDSVSTVRLWAAGALGKIGDKCVVEPLIKALENDSNSGVRLWATDALGIIGDTRAMEPLIKALENDSDSDVREWSAVALADFKTAGVKDALKAARDKNNAAAAIALAWQKGGADLETVNKMEITDNRLGVFLADAGARWGNAASIEKVINNLPNPYLGLMRFHADVLARMPEGFPVFDFKANYATRKKQAAVVKEWYQKHKHRLVWDENKRRYFLRPSE
jgi:HEAT repeat protein